MLTGPRVLAKAGQWLNLSVLLEEEVIPWAGAQESLEPCSRCNSVFTFLLVASLWLGQGAASHITHTWLQPPFLAPLCNRVRKVACFDPTLSLLLLYPPPPSPFPFLSLQSNMAQEVIKSSALKEAGIARKSLLDFYSSCSLSFLEVI